MSLSVAPSVGKPGDRVLCSMKGRIAMSESTESRKAIKREKAAGKKSKSRSTPKQGH